MKTNQFKIQILAVFAALGVAVSANMALAADDIIVGPSGSQTGTSGTSPDFEWQNMWGPAFTSITFDATTPPPSGDTAGSIELAGTWTGDGQDNYNIGSPGTWWGGLTFDGSQYATIEMDFKYDTASTITPNTQAHIDIGFDSGYSMHAVTNYYNNPAGSGIFDGSWHHLSIPIPSTMAGISAVHSVAFYQWNPSASGTMNFWAANIVVKARIVPIAPPTVAPPTAKAITGFNMTATANNSANNNQYNRYDILTAVPTGYSYVGQTSVTYAWTNKTWPSIATANGWQEQLFLVSGASASGAPNGNPGQYDQAVDWNMANVLWFTIQQASDGTAYLNFRCKTNQPNGNTMFINTNTPTFTGGTNDWPVEPLAFITASSPLGAWKVTIAGTTVTITTPDNTTTNFTMDAVTAALFADPMTLALGSQPNNASGYGQTAVISGFGVTGNSTPFSDNFATDTVLNTSYWRVLANDPNGVNLVPPGSAFWMSWNLPDTGYSPQTAANLTGGSLSWAQISGTTIVNSGNRNVLVPNSQLLGTDQNYFRLIKRVFSQLQVILTGETAAPGTVSGKTGTPTAASAGGYEDFVVNAVDANWYPISGVTDMIAITSSDNSAFLPAQQAMVNGVATYSTAFSFFTTGPQTITATDTTTGTITPNTSSTVTVQ